MDPFVAPFEEEPENLEDSEEEDSINPSNVDFSVRKEVEGLDVGQKDQHAKKYKSPEKEAFKNLSNYFSEMHKKPEVHAASSETNNSEAEILFWKQKAHSYFAEAIHQTETFQQELASKRWKWIALLSISLLGVVLYLIWNSGYWLGVIPNQKQLKRKA